jgi:hypothetical protein
MALMFAPQSVSPSAIHCSIDDSQAVVREATSDLFRDIVLPLSISTEVSSSLLIDRKLRQSSARIFALRSIEQDWDSYGTAAPSSDAIHKGILLHSMLREVLLVPEQILPSAEGGVSIDLAGSNDRRALIETLNTGDRYILLYDSLSYCETIMLTEDRRQVEDAMQAMASYLRKGPEEAKTRRAGDVKPTVW